MGSPARQKRLGVSFFALQTPRIAYPLKWVKGSEWVSVFVKNEVKWVSVFVKNDVKWV